VRERVRIRHVAAGVALLDLLITVGAFVTVSAAEIPTLAGAVNSTRLRMASRDVERERQAAWLQAVSMTRAFRLRFNTPAAGVTLMVMSDPPTRSARVHLRERPTSPVGGRYADGAGHAPVPGHGRLGCT
jgi:hypothetical protein